MGERKSLVDGACTALAVDDTVLAAWLREEVPFGDLTSLRRDAPGGAGARRRAAARRERHR